MVKKILIITGAEGIVGTVLCRSLKADYNIIPLDRNTIDLRIFKDVAKKIPTRTDVIIHLAWDSKPIYDNGIFNDDNFMMTHNVLEVALQKKIKRVILASSVHANEYRSKYANHQPPYQGSLPEGVPLSGFTPGDSSVLHFNASSGMTPQGCHAWPTSVYGATKLYFEALGRYYARYHNLEVVAIRFGGVNRENSPTARDEPDYEKIFLSHDDLITSLKKAIEKKQLGNNYWCFYAVSS